MLKFTFSEKATKIDKIFTVNLTVCSNRQIVSSLFVAFLENMNFTCRISFFAFTNFFTFFSGLHSSLRIICYLLNFLFRFSKKMMHHAIDLNILTYFLFFAGLHSRKYIVKVNIFCKRHKIRKDIPYFFTSAKYGRVFSCIFWPSQKT